MTQKILLTGASKRVGFELCKALVNQGYTVITANRTKPSGDLKNVIHFQTDLSSKTERDELIKFIKTEHPILRAIIHNASLWLTDSIENLNEMHKVHVETPIHLNLELRENLSHLEKTDIIHICDETSSRGSKSHICYAATKSALNNLTLSFAEAFAPKIRVNSISPGLLILKEDHDKEYREQTFKKALLEFEPGAKPLIQAALYLLESSYSTGSNIIINGGRHIKKAGHYD